MNAAEHYRRGEQILAAAIIRCNRAEAAAVRGIFVGDETQRVIAMAAIAQAHAALAAANDAPTEGVVGSDDPLPQLRMA